MSELINKDFEGYILEGELINDKVCKYPVYIPSLMSDSLDSINPIWAKNEVSKNTYTTFLDPLTEELQSSGTYFPLRVGMRVNIKFRNNNMASAYIEYVKSSNVKISNRDDFYLLNKTVNNSFIYQDDNKSITHIMNSDGRSNIFMSKDKLSLSILEENTYKIKNAFEVNESGTFLEFGNNKIILDNSGIVLVAGDTEIRLTESGIQMISPDNIEISADNNLKMKAQKAKLSSTERLDIYSTELKMTGTQIVNLNSNILSLDSFTSTHIRSNSYLIMESLLYAGLSSGHCDVTGLLNLNLDGSNTTINGLGTLNLGGGVINLSGSGGVNMDGIISHNMGIASSTTNALISSNKAVKVSFLAAGIGISNGLNVNTFTNGITASVLTNTLPGCAIPVGELAKNIKSSFHPAGDIKQTIISIKEYDKPDDNFKDNILKLRDYYDL